MSILNFKCIITAYKQFIPYRYAMIYNFAIDIDFNSVSRLNRQGNYRTKSLIELITKALLVNKAFVR